MEIKNNTKISTTDFLKAMTGIIAEQVKSVVIEDIGIDLDTRSEGIVIEGTGFPESQEGSISIKNAAANISGSTILKAFRIQSVNDVSIENFTGTCEVGTTTSSLIGLTNAANIYAKDCEFNVNSASIGLTFTDSVGVLLGFTNSSNIL